MEPEVPTRKYKSELSNQLHLINNYSILSKYSASKHGYFKDKCLEDFVDTELKPKLRERSSLVHQAYATRMMAVQWAVYRQTSVQCLVILGAGYDMLSLRYTKEFKCHCIEIDVPEVIETKKKYLIKKLNIQRADILQQSESAVSFPKLKLHLISCDVRRPNLSTTLQCVMSQIPLAERKLVAVLNEVCLCYLDSGEVKQILNTLVQTFASDKSTVMTYIGYEPVKSSQKDPASELIKEHSITDGFALKHFPTSAELEDLFKNQLKFQHFSLTSMHHMYNKTLLEWRREIEFDTNERCGKSEEMDLYLSHYALVVAAIDLQRTTSNLTESLPGCSTTKVATDELCFRIGSQMSLRQSRERVHGEMNKCVMRFGHASCLLNNTPGSQSILVNGGFGVDQYSEGMPVPGQHKRLADWFILHRRSDGWQAQTLEHDDHINEIRVQSTRMHTQVCRIDNETVVINDGRQNPIPKDRPASTLLANVSVEDSKMLYLLTTHCNELRLRHRSLPVPESGSYPDRLIVQVGGQVSYPPGYKPKYTSNVSLTLLELGRIWNGCLFLHNQDGSGNNHLFARHSFGMDLKDANSLLVFGGLHSDTNVPVSSEYGAVTLDLRIKPATPPAVSILNYSTPYYDNQVHFINDHQFVNMGGISTLTGEPNNFIELYDLRKTNQKEPIFKEPLQPIMEYPGKAKRRLFPTQQTSVNLKESSEIVTIGGGGDFSSFDAHFNRCALVYNYSDLRCGRVGGDTQIVKEPTATGNA